MRLPPPTILARIILFFQGAPHPIFALHICSTFLISDLSSTHGWSIQPPKTQTCVSLPCLDLVTPADAVTPRSHGSTLTAPPAPSMDGRLVQHIYIYIYSYSHNVRHPRPPVPVPATATSLPGTAAMTLPSVSVVAAAAAATAGLCLDASPTHLPPAASTSSRTNACRSRHEHVVCMLSWLRGDHGMPPGLACSTLSATACQVCGKSSQMVWL